MYISIYISLSLYIYIYIYHTHIYIHIYIYIYIYKCVFWCSCAWFPRSSKSLVSKASLASRSHTRCPSRPKTNKTNKTSKTNTYNQHTTSTTNQTITHTTIRITTLCPSRPSAYSRSEGQILHPSIPDPAPRSFAHPAPVSFPDPSHILHPSFPDPSHILHPFSQIGVSRDWPYQTQQIHNIQTTSTPTTSNQQHQTNTMFETDSLRGSSDRIGTIQRQILAWPLRKDDMHKSRSVNAHRCFLLLQVETLNTPYRTKIVTTNMAASEIGRDSPKYLLVISLGKHSSLRKSS